MKNIISILLFALTFQLSAQIKVKDLPTTTTGSTSDFLIKDDAAGVSGSTKKISITNFVSTYFPSVFTGSLTTNFVPKATGAHALANSLLYDNGTNVGVGTTTPLTKLHVIGTVYASNSLFSGIPVSSDGQLSFFNASNANVFTIKSGATASTFSWTLPTAQGAANTLLSNNGSGTLSWATPVTAGIVGGTGTQNYVAKWNNAGGTSIGNSQIFDNGTNVGIGTTVATRLLDVFGDTHMDRLFTDGNATIGGNANLATGNVNVTAGNINVTAGNINALVGNVNSLQSIVGVGSASTGVLTFKNSSNGNNLKLQAGVTANDITYILPITDPTAGQVLSSSAPSGGIATTSWTTASSLSGLTTNKLLKAGSPTTAINSNLSDDGTNISVASNKKITSQNTTKVAMDFGSTGVEEFNVYTSNGINKGYTPYLHMDTFNFQLNYRPSLVSGLSGSGVIGSEGLLTLIGDTLIQLQGPVQIDNGSQGNKKLLQSNANGYATWVQGVTTKGDIYTYSTTNARLPVGSNGQVLVAASGATTGLSWSSVVGTTGPTGTAGATGATGATGSITALAAIGSSPNANGATLSGTTLNLEPASASFGGVITNGTQTIGGVKTLTSPIFVTPALGTPASGVLTNTTGLPLTTGVTGVLPIANGGTNKSTWTANSIAFVPSTNVLGESANLTFDGTHMGINTTLSGSLFTFDITANVATENTGFRATTYRNGSSGTSFFLCRNANGSLASPTATGSGNPLFAFDGQGWSTAGTPGFYYSGEIALLCDGTPTASSVPGRLVFSTSSTGAILNEAMRIDSKQNVGIGSTNPGATLDVTGTARISGIITATGGILGTATNNSATAGNVGEEINSATSTYTNYTTTATYQQVASITLTAGDWDISAFGSLSFNGATLTVGSNALFVISTTTASATGVTEGKNISYVDQNALGTSIQSTSISPYRVSISGSTTYYLNSQSTFTLGNPQFVGSIRARRMR